MLTHLNFIPKNAKIFVNLDILHKYLFLQFVFLSIFSRILNLNNKSFNTTNKYIYFYLLTNIWS